MNIESNKLTLYPVCILWKSVFFNILKSNCCIVWSFLFEKAFFSSGLEIKMCPRLEVTIRAAAELIQTTSYPVVAEKAYSSVENLIFYFHKHSKCNNFWNYSIYQKGRLLTILSDDCRLVITQIIVLFHFRSLCLNKKQCNFNFHVKTFYSEHSCMNWRWKVLFGTLFQLVVSILFLVLFLKHKL